MQNELALFTASFGKTIQDCPEIFPAFNNYYQDIGPGGSRLGNLTKVDGVLLFPANGDPNRIYEALHFEWFINGIKVSDKQNPTLADIKPQVAAGIVQLSVRITHLPTQCSAFRKEWAWLQYQDLPAEFPEDGPGILDVFVPFYPNVDPRQEYMVLDWDYNRDGKVSSTDLTIFLSKFTFE